jgi:hypothetical protein
MRNPNAVHEVVRDIILGAQSKTALETFKAFYALADLIRAAREEWAKIDVLLLPTAGTTYKIAEMLADPIRLNTELGTYTNFVNLMDLAAITVPAGFRPDGIPFRGDARRPSAFRWDARRYRRCHHCLRRLARMARPSERRAAEKPNGLDSAEQYENEDHDKDHAENAGRSGSPRGAIRPAGQGAKQEQNKNDEKNRSEHVKLRGWGVFCGCACFNNARNVTWVHLPRSELSRLLVVRSISCLLQANSYPPGGSP